MFSLEPITASWPGLRGRAVLECLAKQDESNRPPPGGHDDGEGSITVDVIAVQGRHLALSLLLPSRQASVVCAFESVEEGQCQPSEALQRLFVKELSLGNSFRLPHVVLTESTDHRVAVLHFFTTVYLASELRLYCMLQNGETKIWARCVSSEGPEWVPVATFTIPLRGPFCGAQVDGKTGRLLYIEEIGVEEGAGGPPDRVRVVSRQLTFEPQTESMAEVLAIGCSVSLIQARPYDLDTIKVGSKGCWIISRHQVAYNCFTSKRMATLNIQGQGGPTTTQPQQQGDKKTSLWFALHALTEQLISYELTGSLSVFTFASGAITRRTLHPSLPSPPPYIHGFAVHGNAAVLLTHSTLTIYHLRTGQLWQVLPLPPRSTSGVESHDDGCCWKFWSDRTGPTALGLWSGSEILRLVAPSALNEQALIMSEGPKRLRTAAEACEAYGSSMQASRDVRALEAALIARKKGHQDPLATAGRMGLSLPLIVQVAFGQRLPLARSQALAAAVDRALDDTKNLREEVRRIATNPVITSSMSGSRMKMVQLAQQLREGRLELSPLFLTVEAVLGEWARSARTPAAQLLKEGLQEEQGRSVGEGQDVKFGLTSFELAGKVAAASTEEDLVAIMSCLCEDWGSESLDSGLLYCCCVGEDGFLETLSLLFFRFRPDLLLRLVTRLETLRASLAGVAPSFRRTPWHFRKRLLTDRDKKGAIRIMFEEEEEEEKRAGTLGEEEREDDAISYDSSSLSGSPQGLGKEKLGAASTSGEIMKPETTTPDPTDESSASGDDYEEAGYSEYYEASRMLYLRALRLLPRPGEDRAREDTYLALLEGAQRFVEMARLLVQSGRWEDALVVLDGLRDPPQRFPHQASFANQVFRFLLETALGVEDGGIVEDVMARRPQHLTPLQVVQLAKSMVARHQDMRLGPLKRCLSLLFEKEEGGATIDSMVRNPSRDRLVV